MMMKTTKVILMLGAFLCSVNLLQAQVKIGDNPLDVGANRMLEIEKTIGGTPEFFIITDSLRFGRTISNTAFDPNTDALMMKLYGYGLNNFSTSQGSPYVQAQETLSGVASNVFMGITRQGELLEVPLALDLITDPTTATLQLTNGTDLFGEISLNPLDSIFATDTDVTMLIGASQSSDGDTITGNEHIRDITPSNPDVTDQSYIYTFRENTSGIPAFDHSVDLDLGIVFAEDRQLADSIQYLRDSIYKAIRDTAITLRGLTFYKTDGTFSGDRTADGDGRAFDLNFTELDSFNVDESNTINFSADNNINTSSTTGDINTTATAGDVNLTGDNVNVTGILNSNTTVNLTDYPSRMPTGNESNLLGVSASGEVVTVSLDSIGGDAQLSAPVDLDEDGVEENTVDEAIQASNREIDSTIYNYNGILTADRTMTMDGNTLTFAGSDTVLISNDGRLAVGRGTFTPNTITSNVMLEVAGDIYASQVFSSSDRRFKKNINKVDGALDKVLSMEGVTYDFRTEEFANRNFPVTHQLGFIAQDVEKVVPEVVLTNGDGYKAVDYSKLTALLNEAIKEQQTQINSQSDLIKTQQAMLTAIMSQNTTLAQEMADIKSQLQNVSNDSMSEE